VVAVVGAQHLWQWWQCYTGLSAALQPGMQRLAGPLAARAGQLPAVD
jgi:hypothetical protein